MTDKPHKTKSNPETQSLDELAREIAERGNDMQTTHSKDGLKVFEVSKKQKETNMPKFTDLLGQRFGKLFVTKYAGSSQWEVKCDCGNTAIVDGGGLRHGRIKSCGCLFNRSKAENLIGKQFGELTVLSYAYSKSGKAYWNCKCSCGRETIIQGCHLRDGSATICSGDRKRPASRKKAESKGTNLHDVRLYRIWLAIKNRCQNPNASNYNYYGERGISICEEWLDFQNFYDWSMGNGYTDELSIDRIDVNGNYEPSNCRWATNIEQANNKRNSRVVDVNGEKLTITQIARQYNTTPYRVSKYLVDKRNENQALNASKA